MFDLTYESCVGFCDCFVQDHAHVMDERQEDDGIHPFRKYGRSERTNRSGRTNPSGKSSVSLKSRPASMDEDARRSEASQEPEARFSLFRAGGTSDVSRKCSLHHASKQKKK